MAYDIEEISRGFQEAMQEARDVSVDTDIDSQQRTRRFLEHGFAEAGRVLGDMLDARFKDAGGRKYLRRLFPNGPVAQGMRIAGLPVPYMTEDKGQGTARQVEEFSSTLTR